MPGDVYPGALVREGDFPWGRIYRQHSARTSDWMMPCRCVRSSFTVWNKSTTPSYRILSSRMLSAMNTPVLPTPALDTTSRTSPATVRQRLNNAISAVPNAKAIEIHGMMKPKKNIQSGIHSSTVALKKLYSFYNSNFEYSCAHYWLMHCVLLTLQIFCPAKHLLIS